MYFIEPEFNPGRLMSSDLTRTVIIMGDIRKVSVICQAFHGGVAQKFQITEA